MKIKLSALFLMLLLSKGSFAALITYSFEGRITNADNDPYGEFVLGESISGQFQIDDLTRYEYIQNWATSPVSSLAVTGYNNVQMSVATSAGITSSTSNVYSNRLEIINDEVLSGSYFDRLTMTSHFLTSPYRNVLFFQLMLQSPGYRMPTSGPTPDILTEDDATQSVFDLSRGTATGRFDRGDWGDIFFTIDSFRSSYQRPVTPDPVTPPTLQVSEPPLFAMIGLGILGLMFKRKRIETTLV